jgi:hypothetical protein
MKPMKAVQPLIVIALSLSMALPALALPAVQSSIHKPGAATSSKSNANKPNAMAHHHPKHKRLIHHHK